MSVDDDTAQVRELADAAAVHSAREEVRRAIADLAARPLDERLTDQMRRALRRSRSRPVREALRRLNADTAGRPLNVISLEASTSEEAS